MISYMKYSCVSRLESRKSGLLKWPGAPLVASLTTRVRKLLGFEFAPLSDRPTGVAAFSAHRNDQLSLCVSGQGTVRRQPGHNVLKNLIQEGDSTVAVFDQDFIIRS